MGSKAEWRAKEWISELEDRQLEITQSEQHREKNTENRLQNYNKRSNIFVIGAPEGGKKESRAGKILKDGQNSQKFSKRYKPTDSRSWYIPNRINLKKPTARHVIVKLLNTEDKTLEKSERNDTLPIEENQFKCSGFFLRNHIDEKEVVQHFFKCWKKRTVNLGYTVKISFRNEGGIKIFSDEGKMKIMCH